MVGKILLVDDVATNRIVMKVKLAEAGYRPLVAVDGARCLALAASEIPDLILLDLHLPDMSGIDLIIRLRAGPLTKSIPIVVYSAANDPQTLAAAYRAGADAIQTKSADDQALMARIRSLIRSRVMMETLDANGGSFAVLGLAESSTAFDVPGHVALITARPDTALLLRRELVRHGPNRVSAMTTEEALSEGMQTGTTPDIFVIESDLAATGGGLRLMSELRSRSNTRHAAFCVLVPPDSSTAAAMALDLGAHDTVTSKVNPEELSLRLARLLTRKREADQTRALVRDGLRLAMIDSLTGLHNRRYGIAQLSSICDRARQSCADFAVMVVDIDRFKSVNDRWGHAAGDAVLVEVAGRLTRVLRSSDLLARIGGEEFLLILPGVDVQEAHKRLQSICQGLAASPLPTRSGARSVTLSAGLALWPAQGGALDELLHAADVALYEAKRAGRNRVQVCTQA